MALQLLDFAILLIDFLDFLSDFVRFLPVKTFNIDLGLLPLPENFLLQVGLLGKVQDSL